MSYSCSVYMPFFFKWDGTIEHNFNKLAIIPSIKKFSLLSSNTDSTDEITCGKKGVTKFQRFFEVRGVNVIHLSAHF